MKKRNKKGELTTEQLVTIIILIASFVIVLLLLFRLDLGKVTEDEICHNSVVLTAMGKSLVSELDCKTSYVCISGGEDCEGIIPTDTIEINLEGEDEEIKKEIMDALAREMANCWWMFGEGELAYMGTDFQGDHCALCSIIKFDSSIQEKFSEITYTEFYTYLASKEKDESQTYLEYLYGTSNLEMVESMFDGINIESSEILIVDKFVVLTGINPNWPNEDGIVFPTLVEYTAIKSKTKCDVFDITQA